MPSIRERLALTGETFESDQLKKWFKTQREAAMKADEEVEKRLILKRWNQFIKSSFRIPIRPFQCCRP
jgi:hypothetical protein